MHLTAAEKLEIKQLLGTHKYAFLSDSMNTLAYIS